MVNNVLDPYFELLAIPPSEQPPTLYRLLGVPAYTENKHVITNAAAQRMQFLRRVGGERYLDDVQRILNEVVEAKILLMDDGRRESYDVRLRNLEAEQLKAEMLPSKPEQPDYRLEELEPETRQSQLRKDNGESYIDSYRQSPSLRPLRTWEADSDPNSIVAYANGRNATVAPPRRGFPTRQQAAEQKAKEIRDLIHRSDSPEAPMKSSKPIVFSEPKSSVARQPAVAVFLNGSLAGTAVELSNQLHYFRLRKNGVIVPVMGHSTKKPNLVFQESPRGWHCLTTRSVVINNRIQERGRVLLSGDIIRITLDGPEILWLDSEDRLTQKESPTIAPAEVAAAAIMGQTFAQKSTPEVVSPVKREHGIETKTRKKTDPDKVLKNIAWSALGLVVAFIVLRQIFFT